MENAAEIWKPWRWTPPKRHANGYVRYEIAEIEKAELSVGEDEERERQKSCWRMQRSLQDSWTEQSTPYRTAGMDSLRTAMKALEAVAVLTKKYAAASEEMNDLYYRAEELSTR